MQSFTICMKMIAMFCKCARCVSKLLKPRSSDTLRDDTLYLRRYEVQEVNREYALDEKRGLLFIRGCSHLQLRQKIDGAPLHNNAHTYLWKGTPTKLLSRHVQAYSECTSLRSIREEIAPIAMLSSALVAGVIVLLIQENTTLPRASELLLSAPRSSVKCRKQYALTASTGRIGRRHAPVIVASATTICD
ncbi:hypothetical protein JOB18_013444 [Solea senegalensis]|uniref:Uncharacterized protein n=1 Tax=Solea senegalensis TaxID=28829 RepID=A0AAV6S2Q8_SOLSE|nr:hypothetical protein JOB18_013444 [Solea senegalensis]